VIRLLNLGFVMWVLNFSYPEESQRDDVLVIKVARKAGARAQAVILQGDERAIHYLRP
jgi:hypothetical protein